MGCECYSINIYFTCLQSTTACECSVWAMTRMTRIYSVAFPPTYDFACSHSQIIELQATVHASDTADEEISEFSFFLADVKDSGAGSYRTSIACPNSHMMKLISQKKREDHFALTQIFIDINEFGICNVQPLSGSA